MAGEQLVLDVELDTRLRPHDLERLGETGEWGALMLRLLEASGMPVSRYRMVGGDQAVSVRVGPLELRGRGEELADFVSDLFVEAMRLRWARRAA
jgi:hypothetical protein